MIRILDSNALIFLREQEVRVSREFQCYVPSEIREEFSGGPRNDSWFKQCEFIMPAIDASSYLQEYASIINRYSHVSFYSLKGLGDVVILASAGALLKGNGSIASLFPESVCIVSGDRGLREFALAEFTQDFSLETPEEFAAQLFGQPVGNRGNY
jgi:hypothetical protein